MQNRELDFEASDPTPTTSTPSPLGRLSPQGSQFKPIRLVSVCAADTELVRRGWRSPAG